MAAPTSMPRRCRALLAAMLLLSGPAATQCLRSSTAGGAPCTGSADPANLAQDPDIRRAIEVLGMADARIRFIGCEQGAFATQVTGLASAPSYRISYPVLPAAQDSGGGRSRYLAPITHELAHALQLRRKGSYDALTKGRRMISVELGADFISGLVFSRIQARDALNGFQQNIALVGLYREPDENAHGSWEQRTAAFRRGVFYPDQPAPLPMHDADARFERKLFQEVVDLGAARTGQAPAASATFSWDKISACADVDRLYQALGRARRFLGRCRPAHSSLEHAFADSVTQVTGENACFLAQPPVPMLAGYSCLQTRSGPGSIDCFRPLSRQVVSDHKADKHIKESLAYREQAGACGADVSVGLPTLQSYVVSRLFAFEFGFVRSLGGAVGTSGSMMHGAASARRGDRTGGIDTIEYVSLFAKGVKPRRIQAETIGHWLAALDWMDEVTKPIEERIREESIPVTMRGLDIDISRREEAPAPGIPREAQVQRWQRAIGAFLEREGFETIPQEKLRTPDGKSVYQRLQEMRQAEDRAVMHMSPHFLVYMAQSAPDCTDDRHGLVAAYVYATELPADTDDYGTVGIAVMGAGDCGRNSAATRAYLKELLENAARTVRTSLKEQT